MKKFLGVVVVLLLTVFPIVLNAAEETKIDIKKYKTLNLKETLAEEEIAEEFTGYTENDDQITIYLFRGRGCGYCRAFLNFINSITNEYGQYFKIVSFETWYDEDNSKLLTTISNFMGEQAGGVPYIIIGDQVFPGYADSYDESIKSAITNLYNSKERYDVFEEYNKSIDEARKAANAGTTRVIIWNLVFITIATVVICCYVKHSNNLLAEKLTGVKTVKTVEAREEIIEEKQPEKPVTKKTTPKKKNTSNNGKNKKNK